MVSGQVKFKQSNFFLYFSLPWLLLGVLFGWLGIKEWQLNRRSETEAVSVPGVVSDKRVSQKYNSKEKRQDTSYYVSYKFKTQNEGEKEAETNVDSELWQSLNKDSPLTIEYLPGQPDRSRIAGTAGDVGSYMMLGLGSLLALTGIGFLAFYAKRKLFTSKLLTQGIQTSGSITSIRTSSLKINGVSQLKVHYTFKDRMGRSYNGESQHLNPSLLKNTSQSSACRIAYDKDDPTKNILLNVGT